LAGKIAALDSDKKKLIAKIAEYSGNAATVRFHSFSLITI